MPANTLAASAPLALEPLPTDGGVRSQDFERYQFYHLGRIQGCPPVYTYQALAWTLRDRLMSDWMNTYVRRDRPGKRRAYYLSLEFLIGRALSNHVLNLELDEASRKALQDFGQTLETVAEEEPDAGLGNGGLGRLAACFMDSCATLNLPVMGYGIHYEYGMFRQRIENGYQKEDPDHWLRDGNPWEVERSEFTCRVSVWRPHRALSRQGGHHACALGRYQRRAGDSLRHADLGLSQSRREYVAPVEVDRHRRVRSRRIQCRQLHRGGAGEEPRRAHLDGAVPQRQQRERQGTAPAPAVFPGVGQPAGCAAPVARGGQQRSVEICRAQRVPDERHPSDHRGGRD